MKRKVTALFLALMTLMSVAVGCGGSGNAQNGGSQQDNGQQSGNQQGNGAEPTKVDLRFSWWGGDSRHELTLQAIDRYSELNEGVTIEGEYQGYDGYVQKIMTQIAGQQEPDLIQADYSMIPNMLSGGEVFVDLDTVSDKIDLTAFPREILEQFCSYNGKVVAVPMGSNGKGIAISVPFFERYDIPLDTEWTLESLIEVGTKIHQQNPDDYLFCGGANEMVGLFGEYIYYSTGDFWVDRETYQILPSEDEIAHAFDMICQLFSSGTAQPYGEATLFTSSIQQNPLWASGNIGICNVWSGQVEVYKSAIGAENFAIGKPIYSSETDIRSIPAKPSMVLAVSNRSKNIDAALSFADWMLNDEEAALILGTTRSVPTSSKALAALEKVEESMDPDVLEMVRFSNADPVAMPTDIQENTEIMDIMIGLFEEVIYGQTDTTTAAHTFVSEIQAKLDAMKAN